MLILDECLQPGIPLCELSLRPSCWNMQATDRYVHYQPRLARYDIEYSDTSCHAPIFHFSDLVLCGFRVGDRNGRRLWAQTAHRRRLEIRPCRSDRMGAWMS